VTGDLHDYGLGDSRPPQIPNGGPAKVGEQETGYAGCLTRQIPAQTKVADWLGATRKKEVARPRLRLQVRLHIAVDPHGHGLRLSVRSLPFHPDAGGRDIHLLPLDPEERSLPEADVIRDDEQKLQLIGKLCE
jgi:hypothetical protein